jgi:hypothetical protein
MRVLHAGLRRGDGLLASERDREHDVALAGNLSAAARLRAHHPAAEAAAEPVPDGAGPAQGGAPFGEGGAAAPGAARSIRARDGQASARAVQRRPGDPCRLRGEAPAGRMGESRAARCRRGSGRPRAAVPPARVRQGAAFLPKAPTPPRGIRNPDATWSRGDGRGLWVTKQLRDLPKVAFLNRAATCPDRGAGRPPPHRRGATWRGAGGGEDRHPSWAADPRYGSRRCRNAAPSGERRERLAHRGQPAALIAAGGHAHLRRAGARRRCHRGLLPRYGKQDAAGRVREAMTVRERPDHPGLQAVQALRPGHLAVCGGFNVTVEDGVARRAHRLRAAWPPSPSAPRRSRRRSWASPGRCRPSRRASRLCAGLHARCPTCAPRRATGWRRRAGCSCATSPNFRRRDGHPEGRAMTVGLANARLRPLHVTGQARYIDDIPAPGGLPAPRLRPVDGRARQAPVARPVRGARRPRRGGRARGRGPAPPRRHFPLGA